MKSIENFASESLIVGEEIDRDNRRQWQKQKYVDLYAEWNDEYKQNVRKC